MSEFRPQIRYVSPEDQRKSLELLQNLLEAAGQLIDVSRFNNYRPGSPFGRFKTAFHEYNEFLKK